MALGLVAQAALDELSGDDLEAVRCRLPLRELVGLPFLGRVDALGQQLARLLAALAGLLQRHVRIDTQGQQVFRARRGPSVLHAPVLCAAGHHLQEQAALVGHLVGLVLRFRVGDFGRTQHACTPNLPMYPRLVPPDLGEGNMYPQTSREVAGNKKPAGMRVAGSCGMSVEVRMVARGGIEPPTSAL